MNSKGRPWKINPEELERLIRARREAGETFKAIGNALGYSRDRIKVLCTRWHIYKKKKGLQPKIVTQPSTVTVDCDQDVGHAAG
jgi:hypothetical protein